MPHALNDNAPILPTASYSAPVIACICVCIYVLRRWLGVSKFYIYDHNSTLPSMFMLWDYMQQGVVEYNYFRGGIYHFTLADASTVEQAWLRRCERQLFVCVSIRTSCHLPGTVYRSTSGQGWIQHHQPIPCLSQLPGAALQAAPLVGIH